MLPDNINNRSKDEMELTIRYLELVSTLIEQSSEKALGIQNSGFIPIGYAYLIDLLLINLLDIYQADSEFLREYKKFINDGARLILDYTIKEFYKGEKPNEDIDTEIPTKPRPENSIKNKEELIIKQLKLLKPEELRKILSAFYDQIIDIYLKRKKDGDNSNESPIL